MAPRCDVVVASLRTMDGSFDRVALVINDDADRLLALSTTGSNNTLTVEG